MGSSIYRDDLTAIGLPALLNSLDLVISATPIVRNTPLFEHIRCTHNPKWLQAFCAKMA